MQAYKLVCIIVAGCTGCTSAPGGHQQPAVLRQVTLPAEAAGTRLGSGNTTVQQYTAGQDALARNIMVANCRLNQHMHVYMRLQSR